MIRSRPCRRLPLVAFLLATCAPAAQEPAPSPEGAVVATSVAGFSGPESVRYDPEQDVYFVGNFNGPPGERANNGFISRVRPDGEMEQLHFIMGGTGGVTLHAARGMTIVGDTLWVADADALRGFHRRTGAPLASVDLSAFDPGFPNDVAPGPDGALYVTDTPRNRIYRIAGGAASVALEDSTLNRPNGITWDRYARRMIVVPFGGRQVLYGWQPGTQTLETLATGPGGRYDGVEVLGDGRILVASQADSSLHLFVNGQVRASIRTSGAPADIGVDTRRQRVAVPFVALNQIEIHPIPAAP